LIQFGDVLACFDCFSYGLLTFRPVNIVFHPVW